MEEKLKQVVGVLLLCTVIFILWMFFGGPFDTYYLLWNLFLAWIPLGMALLLIRERKKEPSVSNLEVMDFLSHSFHFSGSIQTWHKGIHPLIMSS